MVKMEEVIRQLDVFFNPKSVAVVGASKKIRKAGHVIFKNFVENKSRGLYKGELYPVNPHEQSILGFKCYPSLRKVPEGVDLAVVVVPAKAVPAVMEDAAAKGVKAAAIISAGFSEVGNHELEERVKKIAEEAGIRVLGPNCLGVFDSYTGVDTLFLPETKILATGEEVVATPRPIPGHMAVVSQSGAFGVAALDYLAGSQLGVSKFVSFGNRCDVDEADTLLYLGRDDKTHSILLYIEGVEDGRKFLKAAREVTKRKPIVVLKSGRTSAGARAALSHTGTLAGRDEVYDAAFSQAGIVRAENMEEFFDFGKALALQPPAAGNRIAIITDAGGPGIMAVDEAIRRGLKVPELSEEVKSKFKRLVDEGKVPPFASFKNPIDLTGSATSEMFEEGIRILAESPEVDGIIVLGLHHIPGVMEDLVDRIVYIVKECSKPVVACDVGKTEMALFMRLRFEKFGIPAYESPEDAASAMAALVRYGRYLKKCGCFEEYVERFMKR